MIIESHIQVDWPIYLIIFLEISQLYDSSKENLAIEALEYILVRILKLNPDVIAYSIKRLDELVQDKVFNFRKLLSPKIDLIDLFSIQYSQSQRSGNKLHYTKPIHKQQDLENKLLWYNVLMLCNQSFKIPGHSKWNEHLISHVDFEQLSIYDSSNLNTIWESGIQFGIKLGLSFQQRFLLSHIVNWVSSNARSYTFQNFNIVLDFILKSQYSVMEIADFLQYYSYFVSQYSKSDKHYLDYLIENNPKACVEMMCLTLSKLATLICTATRDSGKKSTQINVCKKSWFDIFKLLLLYMINYCLNSVHNPRDFAVVMRCFYDIIKIPTAPEALVRPWIKEHKKEVVVLITTQFNKIDIETFHEILKRFSIVVLSKVAFFDYFTIYQPANNVSLKNQIWKDVLTVIFKIKDPPKSIFQTLEKIFTQYFRRNQGFEFICDCLEFDLPAHGLEYKPTDKEEKLISNFMRSLETKCRCELRPLIHHNLVQTLNFIPKLRFPSLLQVIIMEPLCRAVVPEQSLLSHHSKEGNCKELIIALQTISHQRNHTTCEQLKTSYEHYYLWKILASISKGIKFEKLVWSNFPYMVTTLVFVFSKYCGNIPGFQDYAWEDKNLLSFIGFCKHSFNIISGHYDDILNDECSLIEYKAIQNNLKSLKELFKSCGLAILSGEEIQTKIDTFNVIAQEVKKALILEIEVEQTEIKSAFLLNFLNDHQTEVPDGIRAEIDALFNLCCEQISSENKNGEHGLIPILEAKDTIKIKEFLTRCENLVNSFQMLSYPIIEGSTYSLRQFLAYLSLKGNVLLDTYLREFIKMQKVKIFENDISVHPLSIVQFVDCTIDCYQTIRRICNGKPALSDILLICHDLVIPDFAQINIHPTASISLYNVFYYPSITDKLCTRISTLCKEYDPQVLIETNVEFPSPELDKLPIPNNVYEVLQFLNLLSITYLPPIRVTKSTSTTLKNVLEIYSEIYRCLNIGREDFFIKNFAITYEIIKFQIGFNSFVQYITTSKCAFPNFELYISSCTLMKETVHSISLKFNSRALFKSQLLTLKENIILFNDILRLYGELEIDRNLLNSQINEFEEKQRDIKQLLFLNTEVCTTGNSLLEFMKNFSVFIPCMLDEYIKSVLSSFDSSSTHHTTVEITLEQLTTTKCSYIRRELSLFSQDVFEFISFFSTNNNLLFLSLLGQITSHRVSQLSPASKMHLDIKQFVQCVHETYQHMHSMCIGDCTYSQVQTLFMHSSIRSIDLKNIANNLSEFPKFSLLLGDGFPSLCLFELQAISNCIPSIVELCENFNLQVCMSSFAFQSLQKHSCNLRDIKYCERISIPLASQLLRDISQLTSSMTLDRMRLMATVAKCNDILLVFNELGLKSGRIEVETLLSKILSESQLVEHRLLISNNLLPVYDCLTPLFDKNMHFGELMNLYSNLPINNEEETAVKLQQLKSNINVVKLCFERVCAF